MKSIDYYTSISSPWAYLGNERLRQIVAEKGVGVNLKLPDLGQVFDKTGGLALPKRSPERQKYRLMELVRWRKHRGIELNLKPKHGGTDVTMAKALVLVADKAGVDSLALLTELGRSFWTLDEDISREVVLGAAVKRAGLDMNMLRSHMPSAAEIQATLDQHTKDALAAGVFGAPSYVLKNGEIFWGQDRLEFLDSALG